ncbi:uncharacterized protein LOC128264341 [Drosophila gunungcola]|uniref:uncharacterized protein LOC128264341 n=1 Tax=Drosophila gunungcola TaxID=103775 RepID=UPI0022E601AE|nr:uncharacterized protein LOC128264341 [Drosophila gunungcola]
MSCQTLRLFLMAFGLARIAARPGPQQNPLESLSMGAMNLAGTLAEAVQGGGALTRDLDFDNPLMSVHSKTALGYGDAMRPHAAGDSSEEEDRRRRKRSSPHRLHRRRRAPCYMMRGGGGSTATTANPDDGEVEARRRRAQRRAANNASRSRVTPGNKKLQRRRRQTPMGTIPPGTGSGDASALGDRMRTMWLAFVDNVTEVVQQVRQKISDSANSTG